MPWDLPEIMDFSTPKPSNNGLQPTIDNEEERKKIFGCEIGKGKQAFEAALIACDNNTNQALWVSQKWLNDPIVIANKEKYLKAVYNSDEKLDADELSAKLLKMADEKNASNTFYLLEGKDRIKCLELYAEIRGYKGKNQQQINNNLIFKQMTVKFIRPEPKKEKIIEELPIDNLENLNNKSPLKLKLVS